MHTLQMFSQEITSSLQRSSSFTPASAGYLTPAFAHQQFTAPSAFAISPPVYRQHAYGYPLSPSGSVSTSQSYPRQAPPNSPAQQPAPVDQLKERTRQNIDNLLTNQQQPQILQPQSQHLWSGIYNSQQLQGNSSLLFSPTSPSTVQPTSVSFSTPAFGTNNSNSLL